LGLGLAIGLEHAFEADHVVAVSTQVSKWIKYLSSPTFIEYRISVNELTSAKASPIYPMDNAAVNSGRIVSNPKYFIFWFIAL